MDLYKLLTELKLDELHLRIIPEGLHIRLIRGKLMVTRVISRLELDSACSPDHQTARLRNWAKELDA